MFYVVRSTIELESYSHDKIYLKLPRNCTFPLLNSWYSEYNWDSYGDVTIRAFTIVEANSKSEALNKGYSEIKTSNKILSFLFSVNIKTGEGVDFVKPIDCLSFPLPKKFNLNTRKIASFNNTLLSLEEDKYPYVIRCIDYLAKSMEFLDQELIEESLLNSFKVLELLANFHYDKVIKHNMLEKIKKSYISFFKETFDEVVDIKKQKENFDRYSAVLKDTIYDSTHRKISLFIKSLNIDVDEKNIKKLITVRSRDVAHGNIATFEVSHPDTVYSYALGKEVLSCFLLGKNKSIAYPSVDTKNYTYANKFV